MEQAWKDLIELMQDKNVKVRRGAVHILSIAFPHVTDKEQVRKDLYRLTRDEDRVVQMSVKNMLGTVFSGILDMEQAWKDLIELMQDKNVKVRRGAVHILSIAFPHVTDKEQVWEDLYRLTQDEDKVVQISVNHYLGRLSIVKATEAESEESFSNELQEALRFFEEASRGGILFDNPSSFCLPFYRSFYAITSEKEKAEDEVKKYLAEAKSASKNSKSKETLIEAVENLAKALSEAQSLRETKLDAIQHNLNTYRQYCDRATDLIGDAAEGAPGAARVLQRGLPIIDNRVREIIREIQENAEAVRKQTQGTPLEGLGLGTARSAQELPTQDPLALMLDLSNMATSATRNWCEYLPTDKKVDVCEQLKNLTDMEILEQGAALARIFEYVQENIHIPKIQTIHISETGQEIVRITVAQISFDLTESFPFTVEDRDEVKTRIFSALEIAKQDGVNIVCLPELCICGEWISEIEEQYPDMIVIGGSFYKDNKNICPVIIKSDTDTPYQPKITPSPFEDGIMGPRMIPGDRIYRYETRFG
jgi:HEAT repeat protein